MRKIALLLVDNVARPRATTLPCIFKGCRLFAMTCGDVTLPAWDIREMAIIVFARLDLSS